jgi:hypothetical protein
MVLGLPWMVDEHTSLDIGATCGFTLMDGTRVDIQTDERNPQCLLISSGKVKKLMRKTHRSKGRNADLYMINVSPKTAL